MLKIRKNKKVKKTSNQVVFAGKVNKMEANMTPAEIYDSLGKKEKHKRRNDLGI